MSLPYRAWRAARHRLLRSIGLEPSGGSAAEELQQYLRTAGAHRRSVGAPPPRASPALTTPHPFEAEYRLLGAPVGSDLTTVRTCWRRIVREVHPDRYAGEPDAQQRAADVLRRVNEAYYRLREHLGGSSGG